MPDVNEVRRCIKWTVSEFPERAVSHARVGEILRRWGCLLIEGGGIAADTGIPAISIGSAEVKKFQAVLRHLNAPEQLAKYFSLPLEPASDLQQFAIRSMFDEIGGEMCEDLVVEDAGRLAERVLSSVGIALPANRFATEVQKFQDASGDRFDTLPNKIPD